MAHVAILLVELSVLTPSKGRLVCVCVDSPGVLADAGMR